MNGLPPQNGDPLPPSGERRLEDACRRFEEAWKAGKTPCIDDFLGATAGPEREALLKELIRLDVFYRRERKEAVQMRDYLGRFPGMDSLWLAGAIHPGSANEMTPPPPAIPNYQIIGVLGRGGMGVVYLAKNKLVDRLEALKVVNPALLGCPGAAERFLREIRAAAKLDHPNVVKVYGALQVGELLVLQMEYVEGEDLAHLVQRQKGLKRLPVEASCRYISQAAMGLQHAHEQKLVHRDIKPANLILARQGNEEIVKILDFGLAKAQREGEAVTELTGSSALVGTPAYMAPEQAMEAAGVDIRADIYSLGCTLYFLLTGSPPFTGKSAVAILMEHASKTAKPLNKLLDVPAKLASIAARMMAKKPARRQRKPADVAKALGPFTKARLRWWPRSWTAGRVALAVCAILIAIPFVFLLWPYIRNPKLVVAEWHLLSVAQESIHLLRR